MMSYMSSPVSSFDSNVPAYEKKDNYGRTPLFCAAQRGNLETVKFLVEELDADAEATDGRLATPLHIAAHNGHLAVVQYLVETCSVNPDPEDLDGNTPILLAGIEGHTEVIKYLIERGANTDVISCEGLTLLHVAALNNDIELAVMLC